MQTIAFYLPQYHVIPENEAVYGKGFTEWDNVRKARPLFAGHYQPHVPHKIIGYYNLLDEKFLTLQHHLAYTNGVECFCYYYYNLNGQLLLEKPLHIINQSREIKNRFCLCFVHASWYDNTHYPPTEPFIRQVYSRENALGIIRDVAQYFANERYITIDDKPLFLIFSAERCPEMTMYADIWREEALRMGFPGLCLAGVQAFGAPEPGSLHLDCMVEFAPNWRAENTIAPERGVRCLDYDKTVAFMAAKEVPDYPFLRCVFPSWDNTPRRGASGVVVDNISPEMFRVFLDGMMAYTKAVLPPSMQYVFINAWNEWGEGCHLEPDERDGFVWLNIVDELMQKYR